jgi:transposase
MSLAAVAWGYRGQNRLEDNWSRLKGQTLGLTPMFLQDESRIHGLVLLLSLALRLLSVVEWTEEEVARKQGDAERVVSRPTWPPGEEPRCGIAA